MYCHCSSALQICLCIRDNPWIFLLKIIKHWEHSVEMLWIIFFINITFKWLLRIFFLVYYRKRTIKNKYYFGIQFWQQRNPKDILVRCSNHSFQLGCLLNRKPLPLYIATCCLLIESRGQFTTTFCLCNLYCSWESKHILKMAAWYYHLFH